MLLSCVQICIGPLALAIGLSFACVASPVRPPVVVSSPGFLLLNIYVVEYATVALGLHL